MFPDGQCCVEAYFCISITVISCYLLLMLIYRRLADNSVWPVAALIGLLEMQPAKRQKCRWNIPTV